MPVAPSDEDVEGVAHQGPVLVVVLDHRVGMAREPMATSAVSSACEQVVEAAGVGGRVGVHVGDVVAGAGEHAGSDRPALAAVAVEADAAAVRPAPAGARRPPRAVRSVLPSSTTMISVRSGVESVRRRASIARGSRSCSSYAGMTIECSTTRVGSSQVDRVTEVDRRRPVRSGSLGCSTVCSWSSSRARASTTSCDRSATHVTPQVAHRSRMAPLPVKGRGNVTIFLCALERPAPTGLP